MRSYLLAIDVHIKGTRHRASIATMTASGTAAETTVGLHDSNHQRGSISVIKRAYNSDKFFWTKEDLEEFDIWSELKVWRDLRLVALKRKWFDDEHVNLKTDFNVYSDASNHGAGGVVFDGEDVGKIFSDTFFALDESLQNEPIHVKVRVSPKETYKFFRRLLVCTRHFRPLGRRYVTNE